MMIPGGAKITAAAGLTRAYQQPQPYNAAQTQKEDLTRRFDSVTISNENGSGSYAMELKSRLSQEVRTATSTDMVSALREQVRNGTYQPDPHEIARKMLLMGEAV